MGMFWHSAWDNIPAQGNGKLTDSTPPPPNIKWADKDVQ